MDAEDKKTRARKPISLLLIVGALIIVGVVSIVLITRQSTKYYDPLSTKAALALPKDGKCLENNSTIKTQVEKQKGLGEEDGLWTSQIYDVPAGTNVNVNIASYTKDATITGSLIYPKQYGGYNFTVTKQADSWRYTKFARCE